MVFELGLDKWVMIKGLNEEQDINIPGRRNSSNNTTQAGNDRIHLRKKKIPFAKEIS